METIIIVYATVAVCFLLFLAFCQACDKTTVVPTLADRIEVFYVLMFVAAAWPISIPYIWYTELR